MNDRVTREPIVTREPMVDKLRFLITDAAEAVIVHEALMAFRNRESDFATDVLRAEAADRLLARMDWAIGELATIRRRESETPAQ